MDKGFLGYLKHKLETAVSDRAPSVAVVLGQQVLWTGEQPGLGAGGQEGGEGSTVGRRHHKRQQPPAAQQHSARLGGWLFVTRWTEERQHY